MNPLKVAAPDVVKKAGQGESSHIKRGRKFRAYSYVAATCRAGGVHLHPIIVPPNHIETALANVVHENSSNRTCLRRSEREPRVANHSIGVEVDSSRRAPPPGFANPGSESCPA